MSGGMAPLSLKQDDVTKFLACNTHIGAANCDYQMEQYTYKRRADGVYIINLKKTWEKLVLAARAIVAIENPADVYVVSSRTFGQRAVLKFASATGATPVAGRFTPGAFTNQIQKAFREPRLLVITDPRVDHQPITEASYVNIPVVAFASTDCAVRLVDIVIPCNNKAPHSIGLMWWMLAREVLRLRGAISRELPWEVMPDLYFYRDAEEQEKEEQSKLAREPKELELPYGGQPDQWATGGDADVGLVPDPTLIGGGLAAPEGKLDWAETMQENWNTNPPAAPGQTEETWGTGVDTWN